MVGCICSRSYVTGFFRVMNYHLVICYSSPWKDPPVLRTVNPGKPSISMGHLFSMAKSVTNRSIYQWTSTWWDGLGMAREELFVAPPLLDADDWVVGRPTNWWLVKVVFLAGLSKSYPVYLDGNMNKYTCIYMYTGWWFWNMFFPYIGKNHPNWRTHIFRRGGSTTNQKRIDHKDVAKPTGEGQFDP